MKWFSALVLAVVALFCAAFVTAPFFAFRALRAAAQVEDVAGITELVDFPALRESLSRQVQERATPRIPPKTAEAPSIWKDPFGAFKHAIEPLAPTLTLARPEPAVDRYLTPSGLYAMTMGYPPGALPKTPPPVTWMEKFKVAIRPNWATPIYWGANRARVAVNPPGDKAHRIVFTFQRKKLLVWKLVHVGLPKEG